jgi:putative oxidoreductase
LAKGVTAMSKGKTLYIWSVRLLLAGVFIIAGVLKALRPDLFLQDVLNYRLLSYSAAWFVVFYLPMLEIVTGLALLINRTYRAAAEVLLVCMTVFVLALLSAWLRDIDITCGCFGPLLSLSHYGWLFLRDMTIIVLLVAMLKVAEK